MSVCSYYKYLYTCQKLFKSDHSLKSYNQKTINILQFNQDMQISCFH